MENEDIKNKFIENKEKITSCNDNCYPFAHLE